MSSSRTKNVTGHTLCMAVKLFTVSKTYRKVYNRCITNTYNMWQSQVESNIVSLCILIALLRLKCYSAELVRGGADTCCVNVISIHEFIHSV